MTPDPEVINQLSDLIAQRLPEWEGNTALSERLAVDLSQDDGTGDRPLIVKSRGFVIRNDDLAFIDAVLTGVKAGSTIMLWKPDAAAIMAFIATLAKLGRNVLNKSADLSRESITVLMILKEHPQGLMPREVSEHLNETKLSSNYTPESTSAVRSRLWLPFRINNLEKTKERLQI